MAINSKPDQISLVHTLMLHLKATSSYQKVIIIYPRGREKQSPGSTQLQDLSALQSAPRQAGRPN